MSNAAMRIPKGWLWESGSCMYRNSGEAAVLHVVSSGLLGRHDSLMRLMNRICKYGDHDVIEFCLPRGGFDAEELAEQRLEVITRIAKGRPVAFTGNSMGSVVNAITAAKMVSRGSRVLGLWLDAPPLKNDVGFVPTMINAVVGAVVENGLRSVQLGSQFISHPRRMLAEAHSCHMYNDVSPVALLNAAGVPMMITHGGRDRLSTTDSIKQFIAACRSPAPVLVYELTTGHQELGRLGPAISSIANKFVTVIDDIATRELTAGDAFVAFNRLDAMILGARHGRPHFEVSDFRERYCQELGQELGLSLEPAQAPGFAT